MVEKDTIKGLECCLDEKIEKCDECPYCVDTIMCKRRELLEDTFNLINHKQELLEAAIAGQETLQKALADKNKEVAELNSDLKLLKNDYDHIKKNLDKTIEQKEKLSYKIATLTAEKDRLIETFGECQKRAVKDFAKAVVDGLRDGRISRMFDMVGFTTDYLSGKMAGDTE